MKRIVFAAMMRLLNKELKMRASAALIGASLIVAPAYAANSCTQADLVGTWEIFVQSDAASQHCTFDINGVGNIAATTCDDAINADSPLTKGKLILSNACAITGSFKTGTTLNTVKRGVLSYDKATAAGLGVQTTKPPGEIAFTGGFTFNLIKR